MSKVDGVGWVTIALKFVDIIVKSDNRTALTSLVES